MERYPEIMGPLDARFASWLASNSPVTVGYYLNCGLSLPEAGERPHGRGPGWQGRALTAVLHECYRRGLSVPTLEEIEIVAMSIMPAPSPGVETAARPPFRPNIQEKWEEAVRLVANTVHRILRYGPSSGAAGGETLFTGGALQAQIAGLELEQVVDLIWRRPGGALEAVLVFEEPLGNRDPGPAEDDWRCVLAAAVVRALYNENPDVHSVWVCDVAARVAYIPDRLVDERLDQLRQRLEEARNFGGVAGDEDVFYRLDGQIGSTTGGSAGAEYIRKGLSKGFGP